MVRRYVVALLVVGASAFAAAPAQAQLSISSFSLTPSTTQAGGTADHPGPDVTIDTRFSTSNGDTPKDARLSLAPGLVARLNGIPLCSLQAFQIEDCSAASKIGHGYITGTVSLFGFTLSLPLDAYLIQPQGSEAARVGLVVTFFDFPISTQTAPLAIRTSPDVGIDIPLTGLPNQLDGLPVIIDGLHLTLSGSVDSAPFTRNPTSCSPATSTLTVDSYGDSATQLVKQSSFTPTGCSALPYAPTIAGTASKDAADDGMGLTTTITQRYAEADNQSVELTLPHSASPRLSALANACSNADATTCPAVGSATIATPLLSQQLDAKVVLVAHQGSVPTLAILIPPPFGIRLDATPILTGSSVQALVSNVPDLPISNLTLSLPGGSNSLFRAGVHLCSTPQSFSGNFTAWSGATSNPSAAATVTGCPGQTSSSAHGAPPPRPRAQLWVSGHQHSHPSVGPRGALSYSSGRPRLSVAIGAAKRRGRLKSVAIRLQAGVTLDPHSLSRGLQVLLDGHPTRASISYAAGLLKLSFPRAGRVAVVTISPPALHVANAGNQLTALVTARDANGETRTTRLSARPK